DPDSDSIAELTADLSGLPAGSDARFDTNEDRTIATLSWTPDPADAPGPYFVTFTAANALSGAATTRITVDRPPVVTAPDTIAVPQDQPLSFNITAADPDSQSITSLTANFTGLPTGHNATFVSNASHTGGTLTWTPTFEDGPGPYRVAFTASNALSGSAATAIVVTHVDRPT